MIVEETQVENLHDFLIILNPSSADFVQNPNGFTQCNHTEIFIRPVTSPGMQYMFLNSL